MQIDPFSLDFAALRTLRMVHAHGSFSRAAESLGVNQSTVSYTVERLRRALGDPLFVRQGGGIVATGRCDEIVAKAAQMLDEFQAMAEPRRFDPATARLAVTISCNFYERVTVIPELVRTLRARAPGMKLDILSSTVRGKEQLHRGESDLLIGPIRIDESGYYRRSLFEDHYVCIMDPANPLAAGVSSGALNGALSVPAYQAAPQVVVTYGGNWQSRFLVEMEAQGRAPNAAMEVPSPANLPDILLGTDLIATVPRRTAASFGDRVTIMACPFPAPFGIDLYWTARTHVSASHVWLRQQIAQAAARIVARETG